ncbi:GLIPR1-like protein 1 isoform X2 [Centruroides sculpturatus]|uniref:GLIPR1-like protein 1 isoform X2 n=1 Tax=Centruroides sculpturatus TaxID=218467 RepID=UPI000C6E94D5|nr:GLIPR1-like protein 1 isoform X2 [Centruroides sculpturatus]
MELAKYFTICVLCSVSKHKGFLISVNAFEEIFKDLSNLQYSGFSKFEENIILGFINQFREIPSDSSNMKELVWSEDLAKIAKDWGDKCTFESDPKSYLQNISQTIYYGNELFPLGLQQWSEKMIQERNLYDYDTNVCNGSCDRYKTLIWAETTTVGCSISKCERNGSVSVIICNFYPAITDLSQRPYKRGNPCEECENKEKCHSKLCVTRDVQVPNEIASCSGKSGTNGNVGYKISSYFFLLLIIEALQNYPIIGLS